MNLADLAASIGRRDVADSTTDSVDIITFIEAPWGLGLRLYPVQRVILKAHYGMSLDDNPLGIPLGQRVPRSHPAWEDSWAEHLDDERYYELGVTITDFRRESEQHLTEAGYLRFLYDEGRCNIREVVPGNQRREMVLSVGRRSGKTLITSCVVAYETYKLLLLGNPQKHYGSSQSNVIQLISVATDRDQAGLLYREASGHFGKCGFFAPYTANATQSRATFQTPYDIQEYGSYKENQKAKFSVNVTFRSCVAKGLRGGANILVALDEVAHFGDKGQASADEVYQAVEPSTRTFSPKDPKNQIRPIGENEGRIIQISSPLGKQGLFYKSYRLGFGDNKAADNMLCVQAPTWEVNPTVPAETFVGSYLKDPNVFFTEFGAEFTDRTRGWITDHKDLMDCVDENLRPKSAAPTGKPHFMGVDIALVGDGSAVAVGHYDNEGRIVLDFIEQIKAGEGDYEGQERLEFDEVANWIYNITRKFYIVEGCFDQWAGIPMEQALRKKGLKQLRSEHFTDKKNSEVFQNFKNLMLDRKVRLFNHPVPDGEDLCEYLQELTELQAEYKSKYIIKVAAPNLDGKHDDLSDALTRMVWCATNSESKQRILGGVSSAGRPRSRSPFSGSSPFGSGSSRRTKSGSHTSRQVPSKRRS